jgi:hypothetical protein
MILVPAPPLAARDAVRACYPNGGLFEPGLRRAHVTMQKDAHSRSCEARPWQPNAKKVGHLERVTFSLITGGFTSVW